MFQNDRHLYDVHLNSLSNETSHCFVRVKCIKSLPDDKKPDYSVEFVCQKLQGEYTQLDVFAMLGKYISD